MNRVSKINKEQSDGHWNLIRFRSDAYDACQALEQIAFADGALSTKTKELMAVSISIQTGCEAVIQKHIERAAEQGASFEESVEAIEVAIAMGGSTAAAAVHVAFYALDQVYSRDILKL
jgi:AhpD family alkylhydroperoxidase|tara:strand:+ start:245 stop:601 length:357 start_codon:yes stop_codon:yes gene_type:complete